MEKKAGIVCWGNMINPVLLRSEVPNSSNAAIIRNERGMHLRYGAENSRAVHDIPMGKDPVLPCSDAYVAMRDEGHARNLLVRAGYSSFVL